MIEFPTHQSNFYYPLAFICSPEVRTWIPLLSFQVWEEFMSNTITAMPDTRVDLSINNITTITSILIIIIIRKTHVNSIITHISVTLQTEIKGTETILWEHKTKEPDPAREKAEEGGGLGCSRVAEDLRRKWRLSWAERADVPGVFCLSEGF